MRRALSVAVIISLLGAGVASAQRGGQEGRVPVGSWAPAIEGKEWMNVDREAPSLVELRGMIVIVFVFTSYQQLENITPVVNLLDNSAFGKNSGVFVMGATDATRKRVEDPLRGAKIMFPVAFESEAAEDYDVEAPALVIIDPEGRISLKQNARNLNINGVQSELERLSRENPPTRTHPEDARTVIRKIEESRELILQEDYRRATRAAGHALGRALYGDLLRAEAFELIDLLELIGYERLNRVERLIDNGEYRQAAEFVRNVKRDFRQLDCGRDARRMLEDLQEEHAEFKQAVGAFEDESTAAELMLAARTDVRNRDFAAAYSKIDRVLTSYAETEAVSTRGRCVTGCVRTTRCTLRSAITCATRVRACCPRPATTWPAGTTRRPAGCCVGSSTSVRTRAGPMRRRTC